MTAARWEYENTPITKVELARKYGITRQSFMRWIEVGHWTRGATLRSYDGPEGAKALERDIALAVKAEYDRKLIEGLQAAIAKPPPPAGPPRPSKATAPDKTAQSAPFAASPPQDQPDKPESDREAIAPRGRKPRKAVSEPSGQVIVFPGVYIPPPPKPTPVRVPPPPSKAEQAMLRIQLSSLRGKLALDQIQAVEEHEALLRNYHHLIAVFLNPQQFISIEGLDEQAAADKLRDVSVAAARILLPTERDTLAGSLLALNKALLGSIAAKRAIAGMAGLAASGGRGRGARSELEDELPEDPNAVVGKMDVDELRQVKHAMELLTGQVARNNEPPRPPAPEGLDDLVVKREPVEGE